MKAKTKKDLNVIIDSIVEDYSQAKGEEKSKVLADLIKGVNVVKEIESQNLESQLKKKKMKLDEEKLELEKRRMELEEERVNLDREKLENDRTKFEQTTYSDERKFKLDDDKLDFEKSKFKFDIDKAKTDKVFNAVVKGLEVGLPLIIYAGLSVLSLKAIYKDDVRVPSETWNFIRSVSKK